MRFASSMLAAAAALAACSFVACHKSDEKPAAALQAPAPAAQQPIQGSVLEVLPAPPYSYLRLKTDQGEIWAAVPAADIKAGATATVMVQVRMDKFESKTLGRTFDTVYMGTLSGAGAAPVAAVPPAMPAPAAPSAMPASAAAVPAAHGAAPFPSMEKVARATGPDAHRIAELYAGRNDLKDRQVTVKGKVTKAMSGIMGKTWIHLSDGSGQPQTRDFDLTVTTKDAAKVGEVITVKGLLHLDRDFGSGYVYPVIVEDAKVTR